MGRGTHSTSFIVVMSSPSAASLDMSIDVDMVLDSSRCQICQIGIRSRERTRPHHETGGRAHTRCQRRVVRAASSTMAASKKSRGVKRSAPSQSVDEEDRASPARRLLLQFMMFGYARIPASLASQELAWTISSLNHALRGGTRISGGVRQVDLERALQQQQLAEIMEEWTALVKATALSLGIDAAAEMFVVDTKVLIAAPGVGQQAVHFDSARARASAEKYSCILFCSNGTHSTALPRFPSNPKLSFSDNKKQMASVASLLHASQYESLPAMPGDIIFFRHSTPHYGVRNEGKKGDRLVLFSILSSSNENRQDELQVYPWLYIRHAFGENSKEFAQSLVDNKEHHPVQRMFKEEGKIVHQACINCLSKWGLLDSYKE